MRILTTLRQSLAIVIAPVLASCCALANSQEFSGNILFDSTTPPVIDATEFAAIPLHLLGYSPTVNRVKLTSIENSSTIDVSLNNEAMFLDFGVEPGLRRSVVTLPGLPAGQYTLNLRFPNGKITDVRQIRVAAVGNKISLQTYARNGSIAYVLERSVGAAGALIELPVASDSEFTAWSAEVTAPPATKPVFRLKYRNPARAIEHSYFYTMSASDVQALSSIAGWTLDGAAFYALEPKANSCALGTVPIYRAFRPHAPAHRYTPHSSAYQSWLSNGDWVGEGIVFCALSAT